MISKKLETQSIYIHQSLKQDIITMHHIRENSKYPYAYKAKIKATTIVLALLVCGNVANCYAMDQATKTAIAAGGVAGAMGLASMISAQKEATKQDEMEQKRLENQIKTEQEKTMASEKRMQDMQHYDQWFFSLSKQQQYEELIKTERNRQASVKQETKNVNLLSVLADAMTAPRNYILNCR